MSKEYYSKGDLVVVNSYANKVFVVVGYKYTSEDEIYYRLKSVVGERVIQSISDEVTLVCEAKYSKKYLMMVDRNGIAPSNPSELPSMDYVLDEIGKIKTAEATIGELSDDLEKKLEDLIELASEVFQINNAVKES